MPSYLNFVPDITYPVNIKRTTTNSKVIPNVIQNILINAFAAAFSAAVLSGFLLSQKPSWIKPIPFAVLIFRATSFISSSPYISSKALIIRHACLLEARSIRTGSPFSISNFR